MEPMPPAVEGPRLNHWTTREWKSHHPTPVTTAFKLYAFTASYSLRNLESALVQCNSVKGSWGPLTLKLGLCSCLMNVMWHQRAGKLQPQIMRSTSILNMQKYINKICCAEHWLLHLFPRSSHLSPCLRSPCLSHKYPNSLPFKEIDLQLLFSFHRLVALRINSLATNFGIQCLACRVFDKEN